MTNIRNSNIQHDLVGVAIGSDNKDELRQKIADLKSGKSIDIQIDNDVAYKDIQAVADAFVKSNSIETEQKLVKVLEKYNLHLYCYPYNETSKDKREVARMAFTGWVDKPFETQLSDTFRKYKNNQDKKQEFAKDQYNLDNSTVWQVFKQVPEFANQEDKIKEGLKRYGITPNDLQSLNVKDISYLLGDFRDYNKNQTASPVLKESYKAQHTKRFMRENKEDFKKGLYSMLGVSSKELALIETLSQSTRLIKQKNPNLTLAMLEEKIAIEKNRLVKEACMNKEGFRKLAKNMSYVNRMVEVMEQGKTDISGDLNKDGAPMWEGMPVIDVHHVVNIKDAATKEGEGKGFNSVNDYSNMCFIVRQPQHDAMHALENDMNGKYRNDIFYNREIDENFIYRIQPPEGVKCIFGFNNMLYDKEYLATHNMEKEAVRARALENQNHHKNISDEKRQNNFTRNDSEAKRDRIRKDEKHRNNNNWSRY